MNKFADLTNLAAPVEAAIEAPIPQAPAGPSQELREPGEARGGKPRKGLLGLRVCPAVRRGLAPSLFGVGGTGVRGWLLSTPAEGSGLLASTLAGCSGLIRANSRRTFGVMIRR